MSVAQVVLLLFFIAYGIITAIQIGADILNLRNISTQLPTEFVGYYDEDKYKKSQEYLKENTRFRFLQTAVMVSIGTVFILGAGYELWDQWVRSFGFGPIVTGAVFLVSLSLAKHVIEIPFSLWHTFHIEEKYGFNTTTLKTFILDQIKATVLGFMIGIPVLMALLWFFETTGSWAWVWGWVFISLFQVVLLLIVPMWIMPLFNKFEPLEDGELKDAVTQYAGTQQFKLSGIFKMDGSKRSKKANAFFTGLGKYRRVVLFDTLIEKHTVNELVAVLAHEIGHYKKKHILKLLAVSVIVAGFLFYAMQLSLSSSVLPEAFFVSQKSVYMNLILFSLLLEPLTFLTQLLTHYWSRKNEFEADAFAAETTHPEHLITGLKKLSVDNLSNLTPHPLKVVLEYSHPPVLQRVEALKRYLNHA